MIRELLKTVIAPVPLAKCTPSASSSKRYAGSPVGVSCPPATAETDGSTSQGRPASSMAMVNMHSSRVMVSSLRYGKQRSRVILAAGLESDPR